MELRQLAHFVAVAEELHFTRAAARVHVAQSSLSASIRSLEHDVGAPLFVRDSRHVRLTPSGVALLPAAHRALTAADDARDAVAGVSGVLRGVLHVGAIQTLGVIDLPALLTAVCQAHPQVTIRLSHDGAPALARAVADAHLDIAFIDGPTDPRRVTRVEIGSDELILAVPRNDSLANRERIRLDEPELRERAFVDYRADSALQAQIDVACTNAGLARRSICEAQNMQYLSELVAQGLGLAIVPPMSVRAFGNTITTLAISPSLRRDICAVVPTTVRTGAAQALLDLLADQTERRHRNQRAASGKAATRRPTGRVQDAQR